MKVNVDVDATPQELRVFLGMPDIKPLQDEMLEMVRAQMKDHVKSYDDAMVMLRTMMPQGVQGFETMQKFFWDAFRQNVDGGSESGSGSKDKKS